jgi:hypothetical protein
MSLQPWIQARHALAFARLTGCGGSTLVEQGGKDATADGRSRDAGTDATRTDGASDGAVDSRLDVATDAGGGDVLLADGACGCAPDWCGCGTCDPGAIACTAAPPPCGLGCASGCPQLAEVTCACHEGRCIRGGIDAGSIGCFHDEDCPPGDCCAHAGASIGGLGHCATNGDPCCSGLCK